MSHRGPAFTCADRMKPARLQTVFVGYIDNRGLTTEPYAPRIPVKAQLPLPNNTPLSRPSQTSLALKARLASRPVT
ncbi:hypothetical protein AXK12_03540 [Cephaloticoccus capnophilus]|uniref:Uncharacterized protein n=2 Tax=Cephaloticoccus capnophilus TaxID=1548208 RepID=A0A139SNZ0_9BACT|nr:hypothetical protein AXK12_03540 [Cephaloticoccus capnophilus]